MIKKTNFTASYKPYDDVFNEEENIHQILFAPGSNVYHSDLNLLQTILQDQISLFGSYFLTPDAFVSGGQYSINTSPCFLYTTEQFIVNRGDHLCDPVNKLIVRVITTQENVYEETHCFCYQIVEGGTSLPESFFLHPFNPDTGMINTSINFHVVRRTNATFVHFTESIIFIEGYFVYAPEQLKIIDYQSTTPTCSVGFTIHKSIITSDDDSSLMDNAVESVSFRSPGADRFQILAELTTIPLIENSSFLDVTVKGSFLEYLRLKGGKVIKDVRLPIHTEFEKTLARRTFDTSGSYTVRPFKIKIEDYTPESFVIRISPGKAYVLGHEIEYLTYNTVVLPRLTDSAKFRCDKLVIDASGQFSLIQGMEYNKPIFPKDKPNCLTLYQILFKPGSTSASLVGLKYINNRRYTMRDIGKIENRIENMEYYVALSLLEKQTKDQLILDEEGNNRFKNGFMVDNFKTYNSVDLYSRDNKFSFDLEKGHLRPQFEMLNLGLTFNRLTSAGVVLNSQLVTLPFSEVELISQPFASMMVNVSPYDVFVWEGKITLYPQNDFWVDTETKPDKVVDHYGEEDIWSVLGEAGFRFEWGSWDTQILNSSLTSTDVVVNTNESYAKTTQKLWNPGVDSSVAKELMDTYTIWIRSGFSDGFKKPPDGYVGGEPAVYLQYTTQGVQPDFTSEIVTRSLGSSVKAVELLPFIRAQKIVFKGEGFKPNTTLYAFFSDKDATNWCTQDDKSFGVLKTDDEGDIQGFFYLPEKTFTIGTHNFKLTDDHTETAQQTTTYGITQFHAKGMKQTVQETFISTRDVDLLSEAIDKEIILDAEDRADIVPPTPTPTPTPTLTHTRTPASTTTPTQSRPILVIPTRTPIIVTPTRTSTPKPPCNADFTINWWQKIEDKVRNLMLIKYFGEPRAVLTYDDVLSCVNEIQPLPSGISTDTPGVTLLTTYIFDNGLRCFIYRCVPPSPYCAYFYQILGSIHVNITPTPSPVVYDILPTPTPSITPTRSGMPSCVVQSRDRYYWQGVCSFGNITKPIAQRKADLEAVGVKPLPERIAVSDILNYNLNGVIFEYSQAGYSPEAPYGSNLQLAVQIYRCINPSGLCGFFYKIYTF